MHALRCLCILFALSVSLAACEKKRAMAPPAPAVTGEQSKANAYLAYTHAVRIDLRDNTLASRVDAVREACASERFGACSLIAVEQSAGDHPRGEIKVRVVPIGVEAMVKLAAEGGAVGSRKTSADDLADAVADNAREQTLLTRQRARLEEFQSRKDLAVGDMLTLSRELAQIEVQLDAASALSAQQRRRIETNRLDIEFTVPAADSDRSRIGSALANLWGSVDEGIADALEYFGYALPFVVLGFPLLLILRAIWRRTTRKRA